jgi:hypothetical protein
MVFGEKSRTLSQRICEPRFAASHSLEYIMVSSTSSPVTLLSAKDAAKYLGISPRTLWGISAPRGLLPVVKIGTRCLYDPMDLLRYIDAQKTKGGSE